MGRRVWSVETGFRVVRVVRRLRSLVTVTCTVAKFMLEALDCNQLSLQSVQDHNDGFANAAAECLAGRTTQAPWMQDKESQQQEVKRQSLQP